MSLGQLVHVQLDAQPRLLGHIDLTADNLQRGLGQALAVLPDPVGINRRDVARCRSGNVGEHRQRNIEMVVGMRAPGQTPFVAHLRHTYRALHGPEVRISQWNVHRLQLNGMAHFPPVGGDHVGGSLQPGSAPELGHDFATGITVFRAARVFGIRQHVMLIAAQADGFLERPGSVGVKGNTRIGKTLSQRRDSFDLCVTAQYAALELEVLKAVTLVRSFSQTDHRLRSQRFFMTNAEPVIIGVGLAAVGQVGFALVADIKQVAEHLDLITLLTFAQQCSNRYVQVLTKQVEQGGFQRGDSVNGNAQVEGLQAAAARIAIGEGFACRIEDLLVSADAAADHQRACVFQRLADQLATRHFADADMPGIVLEYHDIAGEVRAMRAAEVEQHVVMASHWHYLHLGNDRGLAGDVGLLNVHS
ncbi:hypothetical protein ALP03_00918 [Pseudomonas amygdali pv. tabaci]|uniref:Uncharacterized protein n=1 Tax=Pseudomonas amygdali pv. tabaci TaxID=322 RepID=A0A3M6I9G9_PSEAJ|nr:hypothetical protein ALP03_00918 [Pseudomonas amygdali pv. tabaci]